MKYKLLLLSFLASTLVMISIGIYALNSNHNILITLENDEKLYKDKMTAATEVSSYVKRAEGHLLMYLTLHREIDKKKFPLRIASLQEQVAILEQILSHPGAIAIFEKIKTYPDELLSIGNELIASHDKSMAETGICNVMAQKETLFDLHKKFSATRQLGVDLTEFEIQLEEKLKEETMQYVGRQRYYLFVLIILASCVTAALSYVLYNLLIALNKEVDENKRLWMDLQQETKRLNDEINSRKEEETRRHAAEARLQKAEKMEAIGLLAGGVAHDLNNILSGMVSYPELLLTELSKDDKLYAPLSAIKESGMRASLVVADLLTVARGVAAIKEITNMNTLVENFLVSPECQDLKNQYRDILIETELDPELLNFSCSPIHITKCLTNLVRNGVEATGNVGKIIITTRNLYVDHPTIENQHMPEGEYITISVSDSGPGILEKDIDHIFEPFYTKKIMGRSGTGLGLTVVWNTVQDHGGNISVTSSEKGSTFTLSFPGTREELSKQRKQVLLEDLKGNGEKILVVDDEPQQRDIASKMLELLGYHVDAVGSGEEAIEYLSEKSADLLVLDMVMTPGMSGYETYKEIIKTNPAQKAIIASGYSENSDVRNAQLLGAGQFIKKPYLIAQIGLAIKQSLG